MSAAITELRTALISIVEDEFSDVDWVGGVRPGKLYRALGEKGPYCGVSPVDANPTDRDYAVQRPTVLVQMWNRFDKRIELENIVDPSVVEAWAERFQAAIRDDYPVSEKNWFLRVTEVNYPDDPLGQKSRVTLTVVSDGPNATVRETGA